MIAPETYPDTLPATPQSSAAPGRDSVVLHAAMAADSLPFEVFGAADSLRSIPAQEHTAWREVPPGTVFGALSTTVPVPKLPPAPPLPLTANALFQGFVLLLAAAYALVVYRHLSDVRLLMSRISRDRTSSRRLSEDPGGSSFMRFLNISVAFGLLLIGVVTVKYGRPLLPAEFEKIFSSGAVLALSLGATLATAGIAAYQITLLRSTGAITLSQPFMSQLLLLKRTYFALGAILVAPPLLLLALCPPGTGKVWLSVIAIELLVTAILYFRETLSLFISKKVSILHWFLYLCIVEIFPLSFVWLAAGR